MICGEQKVKRQSIPGLLYLAAGKDGKGAEQLGILLFRVCLGI